MSKPVHFDLCVIGAGSGGLSVAAGAAQLGYHVALIERAEMGGDCLNTGCVPSKSLLAAAKAAQNFRDPGPFGIKPAEPEIDFEKVKAHVAQVIAQIAPHDSQERFEGLGVTVYREAAAFTSEDTVQSGSHIIRADHFVIATGSRPFVPDIDGLEKDKILTNENIFALQEKPDHLIIIGGGPIGIEMAQAHKRLGCDVSIIERGSILPKDEPELVEILREKLAEEGIRFFENTETTKIMHNHEGGTGVRVRVKKGQDFDVLKGSHLLVATGRAAVVEELGLEKAGVEFDRKGIKTDSRLRTSNKKIYAVGDVAGGPQFTHIAGYHAGIVIKNLMFKLPSKVDYSALPWVTYTDPELAHVGLTEEQARGKYGDKIKVVKKKLKENDRARAEKRTDGMIKVITKSNGKILGASLLAPHAGDIIGVWGLAISQGLKISAFANMIAPYPSFGEISKAAGSAYYSPSLFSNKTRFLVRLLQKLPL